ncbi:glucokinase [Diplodia corticola]|uniref:Phosphotransferase n=1 Tax=Diplodia corticola TaxID=236234 RepID=A0A1J9R2H0_9PEZI|nr:glucokinase [Diplodia corticola]OJD34824.1 glucokinase [Diplodia corticola]
MGAKSSRIARKPAVVEARRIAAEFDVSAEQVRKTVTHFVRQMEDGLSKDGDTMIPSYVTVLPTGTEKGVCLAVDIGGTNCRVCSVELHGDRTFSIKQTKSTIPPHLRIGSTSADLFSFIAQEVETFLRKHYSKNYKAHKAQGRDSLVIDNESAQKDHLPLGFTFSFTFQQIAIDKGIMARWDKGFDIPDAIGQDVCGLLQEQIDKLNVPVRVTALANDTVGTLMARSYTSLDNGSPILGAVFGTGTNGAYVEKRKNVTRLGPSNEQAENMIINTEWGSFDETLTVLSTTPYDRRLDEADIHPGEQMLEKRVSGMYLGELFRFALLSILEKSEHGFLGNCSKRDLKNSPLFKPYGVDTSIMSSIEADKSTLLSATRRCLEKELGVARVSIEDAAIAKIIAEAIGRRAARLSGAAIAAVIVKTGRLNDSFGEAKYLDVGVEGSLVEHYPRFEENIRGALRDVSEIGLSGEKRIRIGLAKDGSGVGAALIAMVADKQKPRKAETVVDGARKKGVDVQETRLSAADTGPAPMQPVAVA